jgi:hypothetical protein
MPAARSKCDVAIVLGGAMGVFEEFDIARSLVESASKTYETICCNSMVQYFPGVVNHAVTLHPEDMAAWAIGRVRAQLPTIERVWAHRPTGFTTDSTMEWATGSVGLFGVKIARELGYTKIICVGIPMTVEARHFLRTGYDWRPALAFRKGWMRNKYQLLAYVRSTSGWTQEQFGAPTLDWVSGVIDDGHPRHPDPPHMKA